MFASAVGADVSSAVGAGTSVSDCVPVESPVVTLSLPDSAGAVSLGSEASK